MGHISTLRMPSDDNVRMILPPSSDGQAPIVFTYTVRWIKQMLHLEWRLMGHIIHLADNIDDDNVRMILPPSSDGQAPVVFTYTVRWIKCLARGMAFDGGIQSQATLTISTTDTDIRAGEAVDIDIDSDC